MKRLIVATTNPGKTVEMKLALAAIGEWSIGALPDGLPEIEETGATFLENAVLKAAHYSALVDALTIADDSGLSVNALNGRPGVHSARYGADGDARNARLLREMSGVSDRSAYFSCALALGMNGEIVWTVEKRIDGRIAEKPSGARGFGYDPVFIVSSLGKTMAELPMDEKNRVSARGLALGELRRFLETK